MTQSDKKPILNKKQGNRTELINLMIHLYLTKNCFQSKLTKSMKITNRSCILYKMFDEERLWFGNCGQHQKYIFFLIWEKENTKINFSSI